MTHSSHDVSRLRRAGGFSLIELLVGIVIGLVGILVMFQMYALWDAHTRSTTAGGDAQVGGTLAMFNLERDLRPAGMGFGTATPPFMGCTVQFDDTATGRSITFPLAPVVITPGAGGAADTISIFYGDSSFYASRAVLVGSTATTKTLNRRGGFRTGDLAVVAANPTGVPGGATCALIQVTDNTNADNKTIDHASSGSYVNFYDPAASAPRFNAAGGAGAGFAGGEVYSLGPAPHRNVWQVAGGRVLTRSDDIFGTGPLDVAEGVINLKAEYGVDSNGDGRITDTAPAEWTAAAPADFTQVLAIRVALLVRSKQFERGNNNGQPVPTGVTLMPPVYTAAGDPATAFVMTNVDGSADSFGPNDADPNNWRYYRYRVYEKVIPLRNVVWGTAGGGI